MLFRREPDRLGIVRDGSGVAELGHHEVAVRGRGFRRRELARIKSGLHPLHRRPHLLDDQEVARLGLVQELLGPAEVACVEGIARLRLQPLHLGIARARDFELEPGEQVLVARGDLGKPGGLLLDRHVGLADGQKKAAQRAGADLELGAQELQIPPLLGGQILQVLGCRLDDARQFRGGCRC